MSRPANEHTTAIVGHISFNTAGECFIIIIIIIIFIIILNNNCIDTQSTKDKTITLCTTTGGWLRKNETNKPTKSTVLAAVLMQTVSIPVLKRFQWPVKEQRVSAKLEIKT